MSPKLAEPMTDYPNWRVLADGKPVPTYMMSPVFIGLDLPAGKNTITARYSMAPLKWLRLGAGVVVLIGAQTVHDQLDAWARRLLSVSEEVATQATGRSWAA